MLMDFIFWEEMDDRVFIAFIPQFLAVAGSRFREILLMRVESSAQSNPIELKSTSGRWKSRLPCKLFALNPCSLLAFFFLFFSFFSNLFRRSHIN